MPRYDLLIVGAGPAGMACARHYQQLRPEAAVAVLERLDEKKHGIYHRMCGEGISEKGLAECPDAGPEIVLNHIARAVEDYPEGVRVENRIRGLIIDRSALLRRMRERFLADGGTMLNDTFQNARRADVWEVRAKQAGTISSSVLIGADGSNSTVRGVLFPQLRPEVMWAEQFLLDQEADPNTISFAYAERYLGAYRWAFPMGRRTKVGFPLGADPRPESFLERHARGIAIGDLRGIATKDAALVGDAAAQVNPITFGGIRTAMAAGRMAAVAAARGDLCRYEEEWVRSPFSAARYIAAYCQLRDLDDAASAALARPLAGRLAPLRCGIAMVVHPEKLRVYRSFMNAMRYGW
jgi:digeranylgeranylglycerophospholipid reductase